MSVKHGKETRVIFDKFYTSSDMNEVTWTADRPTADVSGFSGNAKTFVQGQYSWRADVRGWYNSQGTVSTSGDLMDGTAGSDLAIHFLQNAGTATPANNKLFGYFPEGLGTGYPAMAGKGAFLNTARTSNLGGGVGITTSFVGTSPLGPAKCLMGTVVSAMGSSGAVYIGTTGAANTGIAYFWLVGTVPPADALGSVMGTIYGSDDGVADGSALAKFSGTAASSYAVFATQSGSIGPYLNVNYSIGQGGAGTLVVAFVITK